VLNCGTLGEEAVAEEKASDLVDELNPRAGAGYPPLGFPTIFAEFVPTIILGPAVVKFYLMRADAPFMPGEADGLSDSNASRKLREYSSIFRQIFTKSDISKYSPAGICR
jgi:hypothetical protein